MLTACQRTGFYSIKRFPSHSPLCLSAKLFRELTHAGCPRNTAQIQNECGAGGADSMNSDVVQLQGVDGFSGVLSCKKVHMSQLTAPDACCFSACNLGPIQRKKLACAAEPWAVSGGMA